MNILLRFAALSVILALAGTAPLRAQENKNVDWKLLTPSVTGTPGQTVIVKVQAVIKAGSHVYTTKKYPKDALAPSSTEVTAGEKKLLSIAGGIHANKSPVKKLDENFEIETEFWEGTVTLSVPVRIAKNAAPGTAEGWVSFYFMSCDDKACMPPTDRKFTFTVDVKPPDTTSKMTPDTALTAGQKQAAADSLRLEKQRADSILSAQNRLDSAAGSTAKKNDTVGVPAKAGTSDVKTAVADDDLSKAKKQGLWAFLLVCMAAGIGSVFLPCVYPIIPITVSFFTKRNHATHLHAIKDASFYALGIILTFTIIGVLAAAIFGGASINEFISNPFVSILIASMFIALALSLFGLFEIQLPASWVNALNRSANEKGDSAVGVTLMGVVFALTSFSCTGPIVAGLLDMASKGSWTWALAGMFAFSAVFALPFVMFALFPSMLKSIPKSGGWMNAIKVVFGFIEIAAAIKYLSSADLIWQKGILTREVVLAIWIAIAFMTGMYLLGRFRMSHDTPVDHIGIPRTFFALGFFAVALWMTTGLFGGKLGELDAILPPQFYPGRGNTSIMANLQVSGVASAASPEDPDLKGVLVEQGWIVDDLEAGLRVARKHGKPLFIDFTGYQCTNCRWMELNMFPKPEVKALMDKFVLVRLYTDRRDSVNLRNRKMENDRFGTIAMPLYAIVTAENKATGTIAFTRDVDEFVMFLKAGLQTHMAAR